MTEAEPTRVTSGVEGLDRVLRGGLLAGRSYVVSARAGAGKTLLALSFLDAADADETTLFVNLEEDVEDLRSNAAAVGIDTSDVVVCDLSPRADVFTEEGTYDVFAPDEVEGGSFRAEVRETVERVDPDRVVVDPITQLHYLTPDDHQFRQQVLGLSRFLTERDATVVFTAQASADLPVDDLQFVTDGLIELDPSGPVETVSVPKFRGSGSLSGEHAYRIDETGVSVFPALQPGERTVETDLEQLSSGVAELDTMIGGGVERGTITVLSGPTGAGKTTLATQFAAAAAERGERTVVYLFEERWPSFRERSEAIGIPVTEMVEAGTLEVVEIEPLRYGPQEFASLVREQVEGNDTDFVVVDGVAGYRLTLEGQEDRLTRRLHALGRYLANAGVTTFLTDETQSVVGDFTATGSGVSYLADNVVFLRHVELDGELRKVAGVLKKRTSGFERTLREFEIGADGVALGEPLRGLRGVVSGVPESADTDG
ncbi:ATPase domain-containing protein [Halobaculum sp. MBLA0147]|uniref:ATPase domain-containing protein n=1 Tax=Halobaculum sp. MBLA0147 TaxID=3079934 RepID=UPI003524F92E